MGGLKNRPFIFKIMKNKILVSILASLSTISVTIAGVCVACKDKYQTNATAPSSNWNSAQYCNNPDFKDNTHWTTTGTSKIAYSPINKNYTLYALSVSSGEFYENSNTSVPINGHIFQYEFYISSINVENTNYRIYFNGIGTKPFLNLNLNYNYSQLTQNDNLPHFNHIQFYNKENFSTLSVTIDYFFLFDVTAIYGSGNEPTAETFHQAFLGYYDGYTAGIDDGSKTIITTKLTDSAYGTIKNESDKVNVSDSLIYYNTKGSGSYYNRNSNLYWDTYSYGKRKQEIITNTLVTHTDLYYFQPVYYTKYLNTTKVDVNYNFSLKIVKGITGDVSNDVTFNLNYKVYYTTIDMSAYGNISTWNTTSKIQPTTTQINNSELLNSGTISCDLIAGNKALSIDGIKSEISDTKFCIYLIVESQSTIPTHTYNQNFPGDFTLSDVISTFYMDTPLSVNYEVVDFPALLYTIVTLPFSFVSTAFNITLFGGTPYALNIGSLILGVIGVAVLFILVSMILKLLKSLL